MNDSSTKTSSPNTKKANTTFEPVKTYYGRKQRRGEVRVAEGIAFRCKACQAVLLTTLERDHHRCQANTSSAR